MCASCHESKIAAAERRYALAHERRRDVFAYLGRYEGRPAADRSTALALESAYHRTKNDAVRELQAMAAFHGRDVVEALRLQGRVVKDSTSCPGEGPVPFGEDKTEWWRAHGVAMRFLPDE